MLDNPFTQCGRTNRLSALEHRRDKTRAIKQGMMQQLLTGRVRLVNQQSSANA